MMLHFPTYGVRQLQPSLRGLGDVFSGSASSCVNSDGTIDNTCVANQSLNEGKNLINYQDGIDSQEYTNCESNLALNNAQRQSLGMPLLPDNCASQFPANANETVYTGYGDVTSGSGSQGGATGFNTSPVVSYNPASAYAPAYAPVYSDPVALNVTSGSNPPLALNQPAPTTANPTVANPLLGTTNLPTLTSATGDLTVGGFDITQNWMYVAGAAALLLVFMNMGGRR